MTKSTPKKDGDSGRFLPGNNGGPGRPKGSRNKLGEAFIQDMYEAWKTQGSAVIQQVIADKPDAFMRCVAGILPKEFVIKDELAEMDDEELDAILATAREALRAGDEVAKRARKARGAKQAEGVQTLQ